MKIHPDNMRWAWRMAAILVTVCLLDVLVVAFTAHPLPWAAVIPGLIPLLTGIFVIIPYINATKH